MEKLNIYNKVKTMASIANQLDEKNPELASSIDKVSENYLKLSKQAQYVGIQGYAIKNKRCFDNCLRQKRSKSDMPYDKIWDECHQEYITALNDPKNKTWNKYASKEDQNVVNIPGELVKTAEALLDVAEKLSDKKQSAALEKVANEMIKEAQLWNKVRNFLTPSIRDLKKSLNELYRQIEFQVQSVQGLEDDINRHRIGIINAGRDTMQLLKQYGGEISQSQAFQSLGQRGKDLREYVTSEIAKAISVGRQVNSLDGFIPAMNEIKNIIAGVVQNFDSYAKQQLQEPQTESPVTEDAPAAEETPARSPIQQSLSVLLSNPVAKSQLASILRNYGIKLASRKSYFNNIKTAQPDIYRSYLNQIDQYIRQNGPEALVQELQNNGVNATLEVASQETVAPNADVNDGGQPDTPIDTDGDGDGSPEGVDTNNDGRPDAQLNLFDQPADEEPLIEQAAQLVDSFKNQFSQFQSPEGHDAVTQAIVANGWNNENEAKYIANWLIGKQIAANSNKTVKKSQRTRIV